MPQNEQAHLTQTIAHLLRDWRLDAHVAPEEIARHVLGGSSVWTTVLSDGTTLALVRLYSPVVQRREVFLGNVLLNDFLFKALPRAVERADLGKATPLLNDLENTYILWRGDGDLEALREAYREEVLASLPDLYFGAEDLERGIHGDVRGMLTFYKCNIEPFPTFVVPQAYLGRLLTVVGEWVRTVVGKEGDEALASAARLPVDKAASRRINVLLSLITFFYCRDGREMQSFYIFLTRSIEDGSLPERAIKAGFGIADDQEFTKKIFNKQKSGNALDFKALGQAVEALLQKADAAIAKGHPADVAPYQGTGKMLPWEPETFVARLLGNVQLGYRAAVANNDARSAERLACRFCGMDMAVIDEKNIIGGPGTGNRFNQSLKPDGECFCPRCALSSYLEIKRLGMQFEGIFPIPKLYNVIFHYGHHADWELEAIQRQIDYVLAQVGGEKEIEDLWTDLQRLQDEVARQHGAAASPIDWANWVPSALAVIHQMQQDVRAEVIPLGGGTYRLLVFILPQLQPRSREGLEFVQKRFSHSRLAVVTLLGFLRQLCGCDGPYYFQSVPRLTPGGFDTDTFYIRGKPERADEVLLRYGLITEFARRVVPYRKGHSQLADWILLAERVERDPLAVFSDVLRKSPIRGGDDYKNFRYKRLSVDFVPGMGVVDGTEYLALVEHLTCRTRFNHRSQEEDQMAKLRTAELETFSILLFRALDRLGGDLLPFFLSKRPSAFEKYPRMLVALVQRYGVEAGFREWSTKVLRDADDYRKGREYAELEKLCQWMLEHADLFDKVHLAHLKRSFYGRIYAYLYPRRLLATAYAEVHRGDADALEEQAIRADFCEAVAPQIEQLRQVYDDGERLEQIVSDAEDLVVINRSQYTWKERS